MQSDFKLNTKKILDALGKQTKVIDQLQKDMKELKENDRFRKR